MFVQAAGKQMRRLPEVAALVRGIMLGLQRNTIVKEKLVKELQARYKGVSNLTIATDIDMIAKVIAIINFSSKLLSSV